MLFHKGAFDLDAVVAPVAIKYNKNTADAYWHSRSQSFASHLIYLMSRWGLDVDIWYLEPRGRRPEQSAVEFANEVKAEISAAANLRNLSWDGYFKNFAPPLEKQSKMKQIPRSRYKDVLLQRKQSQTSERRRHSISSPDSSLVYSTGMFMTELNYGMTNLVQNSVLQAIQDSDQQSEMIRNISDRRNDVVTTWKQISRHRTSARDLGYQARLEYSSWRTWFLQRGQTTRHFAKPLFNKGMLNRVSSYLSANSLFGDDPFHDEPSEDSAATLSRTKSFGDLMQGLGMSMSMAWKFDFEDSDSEDSI